MTCVFRKELMKQGKHISTYICIVMILLFIVFEFVMALRSYEHFMAVYNSHTVPSGTQVRLQNSAKAILESFTSPLVPANAPTWSLAIAAAVGPIVSCIVGAIIVGNEYRFGTQRLLLTVGPTRSSIWAAKVLTLFTFIIIFLVSACIVGVISIYIIRMSHSIPNGSPLVIGSPLAETLAAIASLFLWGVTGMMVTILTKSTMFGAIAGIVWPYIESLALDQLPIRQVLPLYNQKSLLSHAFAQIGQNGPVAFTMPMQPAGVVQSATITCIYIILFLLLSLSVYRRQSVQ
ncbi:ABC transporter permease subunit [Alicyclobacillus fructus]|uniref:ABC transporter permease subunit n=1 Tax=Alicyclobacillus fructus TaxID=2816082 RepID=UPI001A8F7A36|nr:ABC transporter permease subunit [Alicyclobacillus fructus]